MRAFRTKLAEWGVKREDLERSRTALSSNSQTLDSDVVTNNFGASPSGTQQSTAPAASGIGVEDESDNTVSSNAREK